MAFATGHTPRTGFVAGQLRDGDSLGMFDSTFGGVPYKFEFKIRYYKNQMFIVGTKYDSTGKTVVGDGGTVSPDWIKGVVGNALPNRYQALTDLAAIAPTKEKMSAAGIFDGQLFPVAATGDLIPFEQNADGYVKPFTSAADAQKQAADAQKTQTNLLQTLTQQLVPGSTTTGGTAAGGTAAGMSMTVKIVIGVVVAAVVGGIIFLATKKKKKGGK